MEIAIPIMPKGLNRAKAIHKFIIIEIIFFRSESETINGLLPIIVFCYIVTSVSQILVFYAIARHEIKERIGILSLTSIVTIFSVFFIDSLQALY